jgi:hypothetical protein
VFYRIEPSEIDKVCIAWTKDVEVYETLLAKAHESAWLAGFACLIIGFVAGWILS